MGDKKKIAGLYVLVVDDSPINIKILVTMLEGYGCVVEWAINGIDALEKISQNEFDLLLVDTCMPHMNGFEVAHHVRTELCSDLPIIALTNVWVKEFQLCGCKVGIDDYVCKPVNFERLVSKINSLCTSKQELARNE